MAPKKSRRGANLAALNKAHPKRDVKYDGSDDDDEDDYEPEAEPSALHEDDKEEEGARRAEASDAKQQQGNTRVKRCRAGKKLVAALPKINSFFAAPPPPPPPPSAPQGSPAPEANPQGAARGGAPSDAAHADSVADGAPAESPSAAAASAATAAEFSAAASTDPRHPPADLPQADCSICLQPLDADATGGRACLPLGCGHAYHAECILTYARSDAAAHGRCPLCRAGPAGSSPAPADGSPPPKPPTKETTVVPEQAEATETTTAPDAPRPGFSVHGVRLGRPPGPSRTLSRAESSASHCGRGASSLGGNTHESKAERGEARRKRAAERPRDAAEPPPPAPPAQPKKQRADAGLLRGPQLLADFPAELVANLRRINHRRRLERCDLVGGDTMTPIEWVQLRDDDYELRRARAMCHV